jgi:hypothetical protein
MACEFSAAGFDCFQIIKLLLEPVRVSTCELVVAAGLGFCFAW